MTINQMNHLFRLASLQVAVGNDPISSAMVLSFLIKAANKMLPKWIKNKIKCDHNRNLVAYSRFVIIWLFWIFHNANAFIISKNKNKILIKLKSSFFESDHEIWYVFVKNFKTTKTVQMSSKSFQRIQILYSKIKPLIQLIYWKHNRLKLHPLGQLVNWCNNYWKTKSTHSIFEVHDSLIRSFKTFEPNRNYSFSFESFVWEAS